MESKLVNLLCKDLDNIYLKTYLGSKTYLSIIYDCNLQTKIKNKSFTFYNYYNKKS